MRRNTDGSDLPSSTPTISAEAPALGATVQLSRLTKRYDDFIAVNELSLDVRAGEFVTLLGPSGSGKTSTLMMIAGFEEVTSGSITVAGREISRLPPHKRDIGVVFQHYALFPHMRVEENVAFPLKMRRVPRTEVSRRVKNALELVQLSDYARRFPRQLSGGQQQRVALARALVFEPGLALMDEPLSALDRQLREQMQLEIKRLQARLGVTVIYVTHDQEEALVLSDRIAVMNKGQLEQFATPEVLYNSPATAFVATFVGESNLFLGTTISRNSDTVAVRTHTGLPLRGYALTDLRANEEVVVTIRPEKLTAHPVTSTPLWPPSTPNRVEVVCEEVTYAGQMSRYVVRAITSDSFILRVQNRTGTDSFRPGDQLSLMWRDEDVRIFPATQLSDLPTPAETTRQSGNPLIDAS